MQNASNMKKKERERECVRSTKRVYAHWNRVKCVHLETRTISDGTSKIITRPFVVKSSPGVVPVPITVCGCVSVCVCGCVYVMLVCARVWEDVLSVHTLTKYFCLKIKHTYTGHTHEQQWESQFVIEKNYLNMAFPACGSHRVQTWVHTLAHTAHVHYHPARNCFGVCGKARSSISRCLSNESDREFERVFEYM